MRPPPPDDGGVMVILPELRPRSKELVAVLLPAPANVIALIADQDKDTVFGDEIVAAEAKSFDTKETKLELLGLFRASVVMVKVEPLPKI